MTQHDVALKAGVGHTTVSLVLKDHPKISAATKARVLDAVQKLGYAPDPMLSALAAYRTRQRPRAFQGTLGWLICASDGFKWDNGPYYAGYYAGAVKRAAFHGFQFEQFQLQSKKLSPARLASILRARNVNGLLLCPLPKPEMVIEFPWENFSVVTFGYSLAKPLLHTVASAHFLNTRHVMRELIRRGYRRIGLLVDRTLDHRCGSNIYAGFVVEQERHPELERVPPLLDYDASPTHQSAYAKQLAAYIHRHELQAIVTAEYSIVEVLESVGVAVPADVGIAGLSLPSREGTISGIVEDSEKIGSIAVDILVGMLQRVEVGVPPLPIRTHLEGTWREGATLRANV